MATLRESRPRRDDALLRALFADVESARSSFRAGCAQVTDRSSTSDQARRTALVATAMQSYADAATSAGIPLPYRFRDELRLYRSMSRTRPTAVS